MFEGIQGADTETALFNSAGRDGEVENDRDRVRSALGA